MYMGRRKAHAILPKEVKIVYKMKDGKTQYVSFAPVSSSPGHHHISGDASSVPSGGEQEVENLGTGVSSSDAPGSYPGRGIQW